MPGNDLRTISGIHAAYAAGSTSPTGVVAEYLKVAKANANNSYLTVCEDRAMAQARAAEQELARDRSILQAKPLLGIPVGIKDVLTTEGIRTTCASKMLANYIPPYTATAVARLEAAGAVVVGKTNMDEFAMGGSNENSAFGPVKHPTHPDRVPGGSSGGSAVAVAERSAVATLGTDTGGSVRLPASYCGVVGLKPSYGRVSRYGMVAFASSLDQIGPLANSVEDCARILEAMAGHDPLDTTSSPRPIEKWSQLLTKGSLKGLRIGMPAEFFTDGITPDVRASVDAALKWYESQGAKLVPVSIPRAKVAVSVYYVVAVSEASSNLARFDGIRFGARPGDLGSGDLSLGRFYEHVRANFGTEVKRRILLGTFALSSGYYDAYYRRACQVRRLLKQDFDDAFKVCDLVVSPTSPITAFKAGEKSADPLKMYLVDVFTISANLASLPAISIPVGRDGAGLPIGLQLMAPGFQETRLLQTAAAWERAHA